MHYDEGDSLFLLSGNRSAKTAEQYLQSCCNVWLTEKCSRGVCRCCMGKKAFNFCWDYFYIFSGGPEQ